MTGNLSLFFKIKMCKGGDVTFDDNSKCKIIGKGSIGSIYSIAIHNVLLVEGLKFNLLSISQLYDKGHKVTFKANQCIVHDIGSDNILFIANRCDNVYLVEIEQLAYHNVKYLSVVQDNVWLWHRRLGHCSMSLLENLSKNELVKDLPKMKFSKDKICDACQLGKQHKTSFKSINKVSTNRALDLLHMDLFGPIDVPSLRGSRYAFVVVDDYTRYT